MRRSHFKAFLALLALIAVLGAPVASCLGGDYIDSGCDCCSNPRPNCCVCRACDKICQFRLVDGCTKCAWSRTWHAPNALATPLREYYIPRPPQCCGFSGCAACYGYGAGAGYTMPCNMNCQSQIASAGSEISPEAAAGFSPAQFERLGHIRNELDMLGPLGGPGSTGRAVAPGR